MREPYIKEGHYGRWAGCFVQVPGTPAKLFSYSRFPNIATTRGAAIAYRNDMVAEIGGWDQIPRSVGGTKRPLFRVTRPMRNNKLGILGLHVDGPRRRDKKYRVVAQLKCGPHFWRASIATTRAGIKGAIERARTARARMEHERDAYLRRIGLWPRKENRPK